MKKILNALFGGNRIYITVNLFLAAALILYVLSDLNVYNYKPFSDSILDILIINPLDDFLFDYWLFVPDMHFLYLGLIIFENTIVTLPILTALNIIAFLAVKHEKKSGIVFSVLLGFIGGFIAANAVNKNYFGAKAINIIFSIYFWIIAVFPGAILIGHYPKVYLSAVIFPVATFLLCIGVSKYVSSEKLLTVNLMTNAAVVIAACFLPDGTLETLNHWSYLYQWRIILILIVVFIYAYAPSFILYLKYRKDRNETYSFKTHLYKTLIISVCNFNTLCIFCRVLSAHKMFFVYLA